jgi:hypothetical protein
VNSHDINGAAINALESTPTARSVDELLAQLLRFLPPNYCGAEELLSGLAASLARAEVAYAELAELGLIGGASDKWLTLHGHGLGVLRATGESDTSLRKRIRSVDDQVTPAAIKALVDGLIEPDECRLVEWWDEPYLDVELTDEGGCWLDTCLLSGGPNSFLVVIPEQGSPFTVGGYVDADLWLDSAHLAGDLEPAVYSAIVNLVERARAAGTFWRLVLES